MFCVRTEWIRVVAASHRPAVFCGAIFVPPIKRKWQSLVTISFVFIFSANDAGLWAAVECRLPAKLANV